jgi:hypothetical protein
LLLAASRPSSHQHYRRINPKNSMARNRRKGEPVFEQNQLKRAAELCFEASTRRNRFGAAYCWKAQKTAKEKKACLRPVACSLNVAAGLVKVS